MPHDKLDGLLAGLAERDGSDLHVKGGSPPRIRVNGALRRIDHEADLTASMVIEMAAATMRPDVAQGFERRNEADFAYAV